jgi:hypothetical protein
MFAHKQYNPAPKSDRFQLGFAVGIDTMFLILCILL